MSNSRIVNLINNFKTKNVLVVGDVILDLYIRGEVERISPEAPVPVISEKERIYILGGAGNVAANIASLGGKATLAGVCGDDPEHKILQDLCASRRIDCKLIAENGRPTSLKTRPVSGRHQFLRIDREISENISKSTEKKLISLLEKSRGFDTVVLADYSKGCLTPRVVDFLKKYFGAKKIIVGAKPRNVERYRGVSLVVMNLKEAYAVTGIGADSNALSLRAAKSISKLLNSSVVITRGEYGMTAYDKVTRKAAHIPTKAIHVYDVTGAGDTALAAMSLMVGGGANLKDAACVANHAAGIVVGIEGIATVTPAELKASIDS